MQVVVGSDPAPPTIQVTERGGASGSRREDARPRGASIPSMVLAGLEIDQQGLQDLCRDLLVEFRPGESVGLRFFRIQDEQGGLFGHPVDLSTPGFLSPHFREHVEKESVPSYEAA